MSLKSELISGHAVVPQWPVSAGEQRVMCAIEVERELECLRAELLRVTELEMQIQILEDDLAAAKALLRDVLDQCRETDKMQWDGHLYKRIRAALGEPMTDSERLTAAGYRRRPGRKAIGDDE